MNLQENSASGLAICFVLVPCRSHTHRLGCQEASSFSLLPICAMYSIIGTYICLYAYLVSLYVAIFILIPYHELVPDR